MVAPRCSKCGAFGPAGTAYCAFCGAPVSTGSAPRPLPAAGGSAAFGPPYGTGGWFPASTPAVPSAASPEARARERRALTYVMWAAVLIVAAGALSVGADLATSTVRGSLRLGTPFLALSLAAAACEFVVVALCYLAFRGLAATDSRFSTPSKLTLLLGAAIAAGFAVLDPLIGAINQLESCITGAGTNQTAQVACLSGGSLAAVLGVTIVLGIVALVGYIGLLIGLWRLGGRYAVTYFKVGAVLVIFPFLNIVGGILILLGARAARDLRGPPSGI